MIISYTHRYVYIGIPRTASKSMNHWLCEWFDGRFHGEHHDYVVPEEAAGYLVFTIVRNPYDRATSGHFGVTWDDQAPTEAELGDCRTVQERLGRFRSVLETRQRQVQKDLPVQSPIPLDERIRDAVEANEKEDHGINQKRFVERAGVHVALYFERLPACLAQLPFVDRGRIPPFPRHPERGIRPPGTFFDFFESTDDEAVVWAGAAEDFAAFGYRRFAWGLVEAAPDALWLGRPSRSDR
jgi:hypothetical protein